MALRKIEAARVEVRITGVFDMPAARKLCDQLIHSARTPFVVDLGIVREVHDDALAHLGHAVSLLRGRVRLRGLTRHQARLMTYLAGETEETAPATLRALRVDVTAIP